MTRQPWERPWDYPGLPFRRDDQRCANHQNQCAFRDDDPTRCPWCHVPLTVLEHFGHSDCLHAQREHTKKRARDALRARRRPSSTPVDPSTEEPLKGPQIGDTDDIAHVQDH